MYCIGLTNENGISLLKDVPKPDAWLVFKKVKKKNLL